MNKFGRKIAVTLLGILMTAGVLMLSACGSCKKHVAVDAPENATTYREVPPDDGSDPTAHTALENIGYMAYVLDNQPFYHAYAKNSSKSMGYEQITQTWKDYKSAELSGVGRSVMVASDLSYSSLVKSSTQSCFIGDNEAHMRSGNKPGSKTAAPLSISWSNGEPSHYDKQSYLTSYGEFSTEITVYVVNEDTISSESEVTDNGDGTYSLTVQLKQEAACWYQFGMKNRGSLKDYPLFKKISLTFTFDSSWQVLSTYCEESAEIKAKQLGGIPTTSTSKTTTTFGYTAEDFDNDHYAYFDSFFKNYIGETEGSGSPEVEEPTYLDVLAGGFSGVMAGEGQQFALNLTVGETTYDGKVFIKMDDISSVKETLDLRLALEKHGSGKQDFYACYSNGAVSVYYSTDFALTADIDGVMAAFNNISAFISNTFAQPALADLDEEEGTDGEEEDIFGNLLAILEDSFNLEDTYAEIVLNTDELPFGLGIDASLRFSRTIEEDGSSVFSFTSLNLNSISFNGTRLDLSGTILPDSSEIITHDPVSAPADIVDYMNSIYNLLGSTTVKAELNFTGGDIGVNLTGLTVNAVSYISLASELASRVDFDINYNGNNVKLTAYYLKDSGYGTVYLSLNEINGTEYGAKVYFDIDDTVNSVKQIISLFKPNPVSLLDDEAEEDKLAGIINSILNLNFGRIITVSANSSEISATLDVDEILTALSVNLGVTFGDAQFTLNSNGTINCVVSELGLSLEISGCNETQQTVLTDGEKVHYIRANDYIDAVVELLESEALNVSFKLENYKGICAEVNAVVVVNGGVAVNADISVVYDGTTYSLAATYVYGGSGYGTVYIDTLSMGENVYNLNVVCDIKDAADVIGQIISRFTSSSEPATQDAAESGSLSVSNVIGGLLSVNYNEIIFVDASSLTATLDVDAVLERIGFTVGGVTFGDLVLSFNLNGDGGKPTLCGTLDGIGLSASISGSDGQVTVPDANNYLDVTEYLDGINALLSSPVYLLNFTFDGSSQTALDEILSNYPVTANIDVIKGIYAEIKDAQISLSDDCKTITVNAPINVRYSENGKTVLSVSLTAYYQITVGSGLGTVYLSVTDINNTDGFESINVTCDIDDVKTAVTNIIDAVKGIASGFERNGRAASRASSVSVTVADVISLILKLDFNEIIYADDNSLNLSIDADYVLGQLGIDLSAVTGINGLTVGKINLSLDKSGNLNGSLPAYGINVSISGSDSRITAPDGNYVDIAEYLDVVLKLVNSNSYVVNVTFDGSEQTSLSGVADKYAELIEGAYIEIKGAQVSINDGTVIVNAPLSVSYTDKQSGELLSVELTAYYTVTIGGGYGKVYINLTNINGVEFDAKVTCDIDGVIEAVNNLIASIKGESSGDGEPVALSDGGISVTVAGIIDVLLHLDYSKIIKINGTAISLTVDVDEILAGLNIDLNELLNMSGVKVGTVNLELSKGTPALSGSLPAFGLTMNISGSDKVISAPAGEYLDAVEFINLINNAVAEVNKITEANDASFSVTVKANGVTAKANGEVLSNADGKLKLAFTIDVTEGEEQLFSLKFVYDGTAEENEEPVAILVLGDAGVKIYNSDIERLVSSFKELIDAFKSGSESTDNVSESSGSEDIQAYSENGGLTISDIIAIIANPNVQNVLKAALNAIHEITITLDGNATEVVVGFLSDGKLGLSAKDGLNLDFSYSGVSVLANVRADNGEVYGDIVTETEQTENFYDIDGFVKYVYDELFERFENATLKELLGSDTYTVEITLDGSQSKLSALDGIYVKAVISYSEAGDNKVVQADLNLNLNGTEVNATAVYMNKSFYITLYKVAGVNLSMQANSEGLKIKADADNIYYAVETLVNMIVYDDISSVIGMLTAGGNNDETAEDAPALMSEVATYTLIDYINALLSLNYNELIVIKDSSLTLDIDGVLNALGIDVTIGTLNATLDRENSSLSADVTVSGNASWLTFNAAPADITAVTVPNAGDYLDVSFISYMLSDLRNTLTDDEGKIHELYSFSGKLKVNIYVPSALIKDAVGGVGGWLAGGVVGNIDEDIELNVTTLTVGLDEEGEFYFTLMGSLGNTVYSTLGGLAKFTLSEATNIAVTYSKGYLTLGKGIGTNAQYKVMSLNYFLDNLFAQGTDSPLCWLLGMNTTIWNVVAGLVPGGTIGSSVSKPDNYSLYGDNVIETEEIIKNFVLRDYLTNIVVSLAGNNSYAYNYTDVDDGFNTFLNNSYYSFGGTNYYALQLNASKLVSMLDHLYAAIYRTDEQGITGLAVQTQLKVASGSNDVKITVYVALNSYLEGAGIYNPETDGANLAGKQAPDFFNIVDDLVKAHNGNGEGIDFDYYKNEPETEEHTVEFGCYETDGWSYKPLYVLKKLTLTIVGVDGEAEEVELKYGSTIDASGFKAVDETHKLIYTYGAEYDEDNIVETIESLTENLTIYAHSVEIYKTICLHLAEGKMIYYPLAFAEEPLPEINLDGYTFIGWYKDADFGGDALYDYDESLGTDIYGRYARTEFVGENGVKYEFTKDNDQLNESHYTAVGIDAETAYTYGYVAASTREGVGDVYEINTLELANEIDGFKVTAIAENAFNVDNTNIYIVNALIPENITYVGAAAFKDNYDMRTAVFFADNVYLAGTSENCVFYGCSIGDGGTKTNLSIYYNNISAEAGDNWGYYRKSGEHYVGRNGDGYTNSKAWSYVIFSQESGGVSALNCLTNGIKTDAMTERELIEAVMNELNATTSEKYNYINAYTVTVTGGVDGGYLNNGKLINITVTLNDTEPYYLVTLNSNQSGAKLTGAEGTVVYYNGGIYVLGGASVSLTPPDTYGFVSVSGVQFTDAETYTFTMPENPLELELDCEHLGVTQVTLYSAVDWYYGGEYNAAGELVLDELPEVLSTATADGYVFLGWAYDHGGILTFTSSTVEYSYYYAIWGDTRGGILTGATAITEGNTANASVNGDTLNGISVNTEKAVSVYRWYTDSTFSASAENLTVSSENTVLYPRLNFTVTYSLNGNGNTYFFVNVASSNPGKGDATATGYSYSAKLTALEGTEVRISLADNNTQITITCNGANTVLRGKQVGTFGVASSSRDFVLQNVNEENGWTDNAKTVVGNMEIVATF